MLARQVTSSIMKSFVLSITLLNFISQPFGIVFGLENGLAKTPPMGWLAWARFTCELDCDKYPDTCISSQLFTSMADQMVKLNMPQFGYTYVNIDDCWSEKERDPKTQALVPNATRFPNGGVSAVAEYVHSLGLKLGIYGDCGDLTCAGYPAQLKPNSSEDYFELDANTMKEWEIDSFKLDGCFIDPPVAEKRCPAFSTALLKTKRPIMLTCEWPFYMMYSGDEINWSVAADSCNLWRYYDDIEDSWSSIINTIDYTVKNQHIFVKYHGPGHWFDPDQLVIGNFGLSESEEEAQMALWSIWAAPLYMSNDLRSISESSLAILQNRNLIAVNQDKLGVLGLMTGEIKDKNHYQAFVKPVLPLDTSKCPSFAIVYLNRNSLGDSKVVSFKLRNILLGSKDAIEQAQKHAKKQQEYEFDANKCIEALKQENKSYKVYDLLASTETAQDLKMDTNLNDNLDLVVNPSGIRAVKLLRVEA